MKVTNIPRLMLRCFAQKDGAQWVAVCVDLNLAAQADTCAEAKKRLDAQIRSFMRDVLVGDDRPYAEQLLARKAPFEIMARYYLIVMLQAVHAARRQCASFLSPLPLVPAAA